MSTPHIDVRYVATLARLELSDDEVATFSGQLEGILGYIAQLSELDVTGIEPTAHPYPIDAPLRDDTPGLSLQAEAFIRNAPDQAQLQVRVPKVVADA